MATLHREFPAGAVAGCLADAGVNVSGSLAAARNGYRAACLAARVLADDVDDAVDRIRTPHDATRTANDFDAFDVFQRDWVEFPQHPGKERVIDAAAINQYLQLGGKATVEATSSNGVAAIVDLGHFDAGRHAQDIRQNLGAGAADILRRNDKGGRWNIRQTLALAGDRCDFGLHQIFQA